MEGKCVRCGKEGEVVKHHTDYRRGQEEVVLVCSKCHGQIHRSKGKPYKGEPNKKLISVSRVTYELLQICKRKGETNTTLDSVIFSFLYPSAFTEEEIERVKRRLWDK